MNNDSPLKAVLVVLLVVLVTSSLVSAAVVLLRPIQLNNQRLEQGRNVLQLTGLLTLQPTPVEQDIIRLYRDLDTRILDLDTANFSAGLDPLRLDERQAERSPEHSVEIPAPLDLAKLGRRSRYVRVYLVWQDDRLERIILPMHGKGMWSTLYGYLALEADLNTIAEATFYEQNETAGMGDQVTRPDWLARWRGRKIYDEQGDLRFAVAGGRVEPDSTAAQYSVDALTGATVTADAVTALVRYWFGPHGYQPFLEHLRQQPPLRSTGENERS